MTAAGKSDKLEEGKAKIILPADVAARTLHVRGVSVCESEEELREVFSQFGEMESATVRVRTHGGGSWALVTMKTENAAQMALECDVMVGSTLLKVGLYSGNTAAASTGTY